MSKSTLYQRRDENSKHTKILVIKEGQIIPTVSTTAYSTKWLGWKNRGNIKWQYQGLARPWNTGSLIHHCWECKMVQPLGKMIWQFFIKLNLYLLYNTTASLFLGMYLRKLKLSIQRSAHGHLDSFRHNCPKLKTSQVFINL